MPSLIETARGDPMGKLIAPFHVAEKYSVIAERLTVDDYDQNKSQHHQTLTSIVDIERLMSVIVS
tara:strand:- start:16 stop:210 length:195 start_codon:yes stop_codon:yes gene_type:complete